MYKLTKAEQEVIIRWNAEDNTAHVDSAIPSVTAKLDKLVAEYPDVFKCVYVDKMYNAKKYEFDSRYNKFAKPVSEAQRLARIRNSAKSRFTAKNTANSSQVSNVTDRQV